MADTTINATQRARAIAALSTSLNLNQALVRKSLNMDEDVIEQSDLPELLYSVLTEEQVAAMRLAQEDSDVSIGDKEVAIVEATDIIEHT